MMLTDNYSAFGWYLVADNDNKKVDRFQAELVFPVASHVWLIRKRAFGSLYK